MVISVETNENPQLKTKSSNFSPQIRRRRQPLAGAEPLHSDRPLYSDLRRQILISPLAISGIRK